MLNLKKKTNKSPLNLISIVYFRPISPLVYRSIFTEEYYPSEIFSADGHDGLIVSLRGRTLSHHVINLNQ